MESFHTPADGTHERQMRLKDRVIVGWFNATALALAMVKGRGLRDMKFLLVKISGFKSPNGRMLFEHVKTVLQPKRKRSC